MARGDGVTVANHFSVMLNDRKVIHRLCTIMRLT
jgi:hypothetical protein